MLQFKLFYCYLLLKGHRRESQYYLHVPIILNMYCVNLASNIWKFRVSTAIHSTVPMQVDMAWELGHRERARRASVYSRNLGIAAIIIGAISLVVISLVFYFCYQYTLQQFQSSMQFMDSSEWNFAWTVIHSLTHLNWTWRFYVYIHSWLIVSLGPVRVPTAVSRVRGRVLWLGEKMTVLLKVGERRQKGDNDLIARCFQ